MVAEEYIQFLVASPSAVSGTEAARVHAGPLVAHDAYTRLLHRLEPDAATLWQEAQGLVTPTTGVLVLDDTTLDKPYAPHMGLVTRHWSGKHQAVVQGINPAHALVARRAGAGAGRLPPLRQGHGRAEQKRPFPAPAARRPAAGLCPALRALRQLVRQPGQPETGAGLRLGLAHAPQTQPARQP